MARLEIEGVRSFLEQILRIIINRSRETLKFFKFTTVSKVFLNCSKSRHFVIYHVFFNTNNYRPMILFRIQTPKYRYAQSCLSLSSTKIRKFINLWNPPRFKLSFNVNHIRFNAHVELIFPLLKSQLLQAHPLESQSLQAHPLKSSLLGAGKICLDIHGNPSASLPFLSKFASQIVELYFKYNMPDECLMPPMKLNLLRLNYLNNIVQLRSILEGQEVKKLELITGSSLFDTISGLNHNFVFKCVLELDITVWRINKTVPNMNVLRSIFPTVKKLHLNLKFEENSRNIQSSDPKQIVDFILERCKLVKDMRQNCSSIKPTVHVDFRLHVNRQNYTDGWIYTLGWNNAVKHLVHNKHSCPTKVDFVSADESIQYTVFILH